MSIRFCKIVYVLVLGVARHLSHAQVMETPGLSRIQTAVGFIRSEAAASTERITGSFVCRISRVIIIVAQSCQKMLKIP